MLILDGWDEVAAGSGTEYRDRLRTLLLEIRRIFIDRHDERTSAAAQIRVILTGRPGDNLLPDEVLTRGVRVLDLQPFTAKQLKAFFAKLKAAVERPRPLGDVPAPSDWPLHPRWHQMEYIAELYNPEDRDSVLGYPLLAHLSFWIYAKRLETDPASDAGSLLADTTSLYRQLVDLTCAEAGKASFEQWNTAARERHKATGTYLRDLIRRTAAAAYCSGGSGAISREQLFRFLPSDHRLRVSADGLDQNPLSELLVSYYFTSEHPERGCEFVHQSFFEYLYAEAVVEWVKALPTGSHPEPLTQAVVDTPRSNDALLWLLRCFSTITLSDQVLKHVHRLTLWEIERARRDESERDGQTPLASIASWKVSLGRLSEVVRDIAACRFFQPAEDRSPALYHYLSCTEPGIDPVMLIDQLLGAGFLNLAAILGHALSRDGERFRVAIGYDEHDHDDILSRAARAGGRLFLRSADLSGGNLTRLRLHTADLRGANFIGSFLNQANLFADCRGADFTGTTCERAVVGGDFSGVDFVGADLRHARLHEAFLMDANFSQANLEGADLSAASIQGTDFLTAKNLTQKQIDQAFGDDNTKLPKRIRRPSTWPYERPTPGDWETNK